MTTDIPIKYVNDTKATDFEVVVFTKNFNVNTPMVYYVAWQVLRGQSSKDFIYPVSMGVGATYEDHGRVSAGPFPSELGSTWLITQDTPSSTAVLSKGNEYS